MWLTYSCVTLPLLRLLCLCASGMSSIGQETVPGQRGSFDVDRANSDSDDPSGADSLGGSVTRLSGGLSHGERHLYVRHLWRDPSDWVRTVTTRIGQLCNDRPFNKRAEASSDVRIFGHGKRTWLYTCLLANQARFRVKLCERSSLNNISALRECIQDAMRSL